MKPARFLLADHMRNDSLVISRISRGQVFLERGPVFAPTLFEEAPTTTAPYVIVPLQGESTTPTQGELP
jgi:hypothetical protein